ncbi:Hypothetical protein R9X50_00615400 [Acrodontium crateriforme]|uniref:N-acetyltransferase domain-containing protein n=1 Tax=Acrodontium crateriforme TaxID=150365 RepID=A0AAQ3M942_9PEZI|nr:Hypothetical protein R9X50_00615400 [Acrodontium crateriforme]
MASTKIIIVRGPELSAQPWWNAVHRLIIASFETKEEQVFPPSWKRLNQDPQIAAYKLGNDELGPRGHFAIVFENDKPVACGGVLPFRGENWINHVESDELRKAKVSNSELQTEEEFSVSPEEKIANWEICCFCVSPAHRRKGLSHILIEALLDFVKPRGAKRLVSNYSIKETGNFWSKMGFVTIPGAGGVLKKGFTHTGGMEGLRADIHFRMGERAVA